MPLVRISLLKGRPSSDIKAISDGIQRAMVEAYNVPRDDCFHLVHQHERDEFIYNSEYLGIHRTDDVVFIHIVAGNWRDTATKKAFYRLLAEYLSDSPGLRPEDVQVVISPNERDDWSFGKGLASYVPDSEPSRR